PLLPAGRRDRADHLAPSLPPRLSLDPAGPSLRWLLLHCRRCHDLSRQDAPGGGRLVALERPLHQRAPRRRLPLLLLPPVRPPGGAASCPADRRLSPGPHLRRDRPRTRRRPALPPLAAGGAPPPRAAARGPGIGRRVPRSGAGQPLGLRL